MCPVHCTTKDDSKSSVALLSMQRDDNLYKYAYSEQQSSLHLSIYMFGEVM